MASGYKIVNGPSKYDLMIALFDREYPRLVEFTIEVNAEMVAVDALINGLKLEDGSGNNWIFVGYSTGFDPTSLKVSTEGFYSTKRREGQLKFIGG